MIKNMLLFFFLKNKTQNKTKKYTFKSQSDPVQWFSTCHPQFGGISLRHIG